MINEPVPTAQVVKEALAFLEGSKHYQEHQAEYQGALGIVQQIETQLAATNDAAIESTQLDALIPAAHLLCSMADVVSPLKVAASAVKTFTRSMILAAHPKTVDTIRHTGGDIHATVSKASEIDTIDPASVGELHHAVFCEAFVLGFADELRTYATDQGATAHLPLFVERSTTPANEYLKKVAAVVDQHCEQNSRKILATYIAKIIAADTSLALPTDFIGSVYSPRSAGDVLTHFTARGMGDKIKPMIKSTPKERSLTFRSSK